MIAFPAPRGFMGTMADAVRGAGNAITLGTYDYWRPEVWLSEKPYREAVAEQQAKSAQAQKDSPFSYNMGAATGGVPLGFGAAAVTNKVIPAASQLPLWGRAVVGATEGATLGGLHGAGSTSINAPEEVLKNFGMGSVFGAGVGAAAPVVGAGVGSAYRAVANRSGPIPRQVMDAAQADRAGVRALPDDPGSTLADAGPSLRGVAQGAVTGTGAAGPGRTQLIDTLTSRDRGTGNRVVQGVEDTFGPAPIPSRVEAGVRDRMREMGPAYERALDNARAVDTRQLANELDTMIVNEKGPALATLQQVRRMLDINTNPGHLDPHPRALQNTREAVRGMQESAEDPTVVGILGNIHRRLTQELQAKVPGIRELDHQYAELGSQVRAVLPEGQGQRVFQTDRPSVVRPEELADTLRGAVQPKGVNVGPSAEAFRMREGTRAELDRIIGTNKNDLAALERVLGQPQDWNAQKLAIMFGQERADQLAALLSLIHI